MMDLELHETRIEWLTELEALAGEMSEWEQGFVESLLTYRDLSQLSEKQEIVLDKLVEKYIDLEDYY
jgi:hypothetical protein